VCVCAVEGGHGLLVAALVDAGLPVAALNPVTAKRLRPPSGVKTDALDAVLLARTARTRWPAVPRLRPQSALVQELKLLPRDLERLIGQQTSLTNQPSACLKHYYPVALTCFDSIALPVALAFLQHFPTPAAAQQASVEQLTDFLVTARYPRSLPATRAKAEQRATLLQTPQLRAPAPVVRAKAQLTPVLVAQLQLVHEQIAAYDAAIGDLARQHEDHALFASLPGAGPRLAPRLLAAGCWRNGVTTARATPPRPVFKPWQARHQCCSKVAAIAACGAGAPVSTRCARRSTTLRGRVFCWTTGPVPTTAASGHKASPKPWRYRLSPITGSASCMPCGCGCTAHPMIRRSCGRRNTPMAA
jgi:transposase